MGRGYVKYRPDRPPDLATEAQVQAMNAKLAARVKQAPTPIAQPLQAAQSPQAKSVVKLEWERPTKEAMAIKTKCGRYSCCKVVVMGKTSYELWKLVPGGDWFTQLNKGLDNFLQAQELARQDAQKHL